MAGYIGKISALVTASTADLERKLSGTKGTVQAFGRSLSSTINAASKSAQSSLAGIFTPLQKIERALQAGQGRLNLVDSGSANRIRQIVSVAEGINKPAASLQKAFSQLSAEVQANFKPALDRVQDQVLLLNRGLEQTGSVGEKSFRLIERSIANATEAAGRLSEAQRLAQSSLTGKELRFVAPAVSGALRAGADARNAAGALSPEILENGRIGRLVAQVSKYSDLVVRAQAQVEAAKLSPKIDTARLERAQALVDGFTKRLNRLSAALASEAAAPEAAQAAAKKVADNEIASLIRREQAAKAFYERQQAEAQKAADNEIATLIRREQAAKQIEKERLQQLAQDAALRDAIRTRRREVSLSGGDATFAGTRAVDVFGPVPTSERGRQAGVESNIRSLQSQIEALPASLQSKLIPALNRARTAYAAIGDAPTEDELATAAKYAQQLEQQLKRVQAASQFRGTFRQFLNDSAAERYQAKLESIRGQLIAVGATAGGPVASAVNQYSKALERAGVAGRLGTERTKKALDELLAKIAQALVQTGKLNEAQAKAFVANVGQAGNRRGGDVGRGGFDRFTLGAQQAAFAIDDFMSATGGVDQKLRAVSNNISQLGFLVGGLKGLFISLGVVFVGQLAVGISKWINSGTEAEDRTKALNDALARQKSLVEDLAQAFRSLGDSIGRRAFSEPAQRAQEFADQIADIQKKQKQLRESRATELDAGIQAERAQQNRLRRDIDASESPGQRVALTRQLRESEAAERRRAAEVAARPAPTAEQSRDAVLSTIRANEFLRGGRLTADSERQAQARRDRAEADFAAAEGNVLEQRRLIEQRLAERQATAARPLTVSRFEENPEIARAREDVVRLQEQLNSLNLPAQQALDQLSVSIVRASNAAAIEIQSAQSDVADAIRRGAPNAAALQAELDKAGRELAAANTRLRDAAETEDPASRESQVNLAQAEVAAVEGRLADIRRRQEEVSLARTIGGERGTAALSLLEDPRFNNETNRRALVERAIFREEQARERLAAAIERGDEPARAKAQADLEAAQGATDLAAAAAEGAVALEQAFERFRRQGEDVVSGRERIADEAQRRVAEFDQREATRRGTSRERIVAERDQAEQDLIREREQIERLQNRLDDRRRMAEAADPRIRALRDEEEQLRTAQAVAEERRRRDPEFLDNEQQLRANRLAEIRAERERLVRQDAGVRGVQEELDRRQQAVAATERRRAEIERGVDLAVSPAQQAGRQLADDLRGLRAARADNRIGQPEFDEASRRLLEDTARQQAPTIIGLRDAVANAVLQGPSRAALNVTDVSTVEGARELSRLLRGDDAARTQAELVTLQRESRDLLQVIADANRENADVAN